MWDGLEEFQKPTIMGAIIGYLIKSTCTLDVPMLCILNYQ